MRQSRGSWWWAQMSFIFVYLVLGFGSVLISVALSNPFSGWVKTAIRISVFLVVFYLIEIRVEITPVKEGEIFE